VTPEMFAQTVSEIVSLISMFALVAVMALILHVVGSRRAKVRRDRARREVQS